MRPIGRRSCSVAPRSPGRHSRLTCLVALALAFLAVGSVTLAQDAEPSAQVTNLTLTFQPSSREGVPSYLVVRLSRADGSAVSNQRIRFRRRVDVFDGRMVELARAITDNAGLARVPVEPRQDTYRVVVSFSGNETLAPSEFETEVAFPPEILQRSDRVARGDLVAPKLRPLADVMPLASGAGFLAVWLVLIGLTLGTLRTIASGGQRTQAAAQGSRASTGPWPIPREAGPTTAAVVIGEEERSES